MNIALIAGSGDFPLVIAKKNPNLFVICLQGLSSANTFSNQSETVPLLNFEKLLKVLFENKVTHVVFAGKVKRPKYVEKQSNIKNQEIINELLSVGDNQAINIIENFFKNKGIKILPVHSILENCFFPRGFYGEEFSKITFKNYVEKSAEYGIKLLNTISKFDVGQSLILSNNLVYAIEGLEGTNTMIGRVKKLLSGNQIVNLYGPVLVKIPKLGQNKKIDLPVIGVETVKKSIAAGISAIVISSSGTIVVDLKKVKKHIDKYKFSIMSV